MQIIAELYFQEEIRRVSIGDENNDLTISHLKNSIGATFPVVTGDFLLLWKDEDGDFVTISSNSEFLDAVKEMTANGLAKFHIKATQEHTKQLPSLGFTDHCTPTPNLVHFGATTIAEIAKKLNRWSQGTTAASSSRRIQGAFDGYNLMAATLRNTPEMMNIRDEILVSYTVFRDKGFLKGIKFFGVCTPSGTGKTQVPFTLATYTDCFDVLHVCMAEISEYSQFVYQHPRIYDISTVLRSYLIDDFLAQKQRQNVWISSSATSSLADEQLNMVALLSAIFKVSIKRESGADEAPQTPTQFRKALYSTGIARATWPVVVVDEAYCCGGEDYGNELASFLRSILRASGVVSVFMGTTINMVKFEDGPGNISAGKPDPTEWAKLITQLPPFSAPPAFDLAVIQSVEVRGFVKCLLDHYPRVNPRNMHHLYREARDQ